MKQPNVFLLFGLAAFAALAAAQSNPPLAFDVASVKEQKGPEHSGAMNLLPDGSVHIKGLPLHLLVATAYDLPFQSPRLSGGPQWVRETPYDIEAKAPAGAIPAGTSAKERNTRIRLMLQALLAERFKMVVRRESKDIPVYAIVAGKNGPKLVKSDLSEKDCEGETPGVDTTGCHALQGGMGRGLHSKAASIADVATFVSNWSDRPVVDKSGIAGLFKFDTEGWVNMRQAPPPPPGTPPNAESDALADPGRATLFQIFDRLGLKLDPQKGPIDMYTIESVQRPTEN